MGRRPLARFTATEQRLEGEFRYVNSRLITYSEEVAFYGGQEKEKATITDSLRRLIKHIHAGSVFRLVMGVVDNVVSKYWATALGYFVVSRPFLYDSQFMEGAEYSRVMQVYY